MKRILILGGAEAQVPIIQAAKKEGYYVILCDWTTTNPGIKYVDKHYQVNTLDREAVIKVAIEERIDGVISNSEPAMLNVSYIANELHLRGNSESGLEILLSKDRFRRQPMGRHAHHGRHTARQLQVRHPRIHQRTDDHQATC